MAYPQRAVCIGAPGPASGIVGSATCIQQPACPATTLVHAQPPVQSPAVVTGISAASVPANTTHTTTLTVQVPAGVTSGQTIQVETSWGPMKVVVPAGVSEGGCFPMQVPLPPESVCAPVATPAEDPVGEARIDIADEEKPIEEPTPNSGATPANTNPPTLAAAKSNPSTTATTGSICPRHGRFFGPACPRCQVLEVQERGGIAFR